MSNKPPVASMRRKSWKKPELRSIVPAQRTAGGLFQNDQEDAFYSVS